MRLPFFSSCARFAVAASTLAPLSAALLGCSNQGSPSVTLPSFQDISTAPAPIQRAAEAVVRIATAGEEATGSFISANGLLLTNNHVLGIPICPIEGCYAVLLFDFQRGKTPPQPMPVFVTPVAVSSGLDIALVQVRSAPNGPALSTPNFLTILSHDASSLLSTHLTVVGHPEGHLKKWSSGEGVDADGDWVWTSAYSLPGNSGSPILDDGGNLVAILHRGPTGEGYVSSDGMLTYSIGTASASILPALKAPLPPEMLSVAAPTTEAAVVAADIVYLNAGVTTAPLSTGGTLDILSALGTACDAALAVEDYATPDALSAALQPCNDALDWIECRADQTSKPSGIVCPSLVDGALWQQRMMQMNAAWIALNGETDLTAASFGIAQLSTSIAAGTSAGAITLQQALSAASRPWDPQVANFLAAFEVGSYRGVSTESYVTGYTSIPDYALNAGDLASAALWLVGSSLSKSQGLAITAQLYANPSVDVDDKLYIEDMEYSWGALQ